MLDTANSVYYTFGDGIKKTYTGTVEPDVFNRLINEWGTDEWLKSKVSDNEGVEISQKLIDDLQELIIITDGDMIYNGDIMFPVAPDVPNAYTFSMPERLTVINNNQLAPLNFQIYPKYFRRLSIAFKLNYVNNICNLTGISDRFLKTQFMRSFEKNEIEDNYYRKPQDDRLYHEIFNDKIRLITGTLSNGNCMRLEYLRYPKKFFFDPNRNIKGLLTILTNAVLAGTTITITINTSVASYVIGPVNISLYDSKYTIANNIYNAAIVVMNSCSINDNSVGFGQDGEDVLGTSTVVLSGASITYSFAIGDEITDVNIELQDQQRKEIVEHTVRVFLERITDVRYKTFIGEENYRGQSRK